MKLKCGHTKKYIRDVIWPAKFEELEKFITENDRQPKWTRWFAWYPIRLSENDCRWLEFVERAPDYGIDCDWHYINGYSKIILNEPQLTIRGYYYRAEET